MMKQKAVHELTPGQRRYLTLLSYLLAFTIGAGVVGIFAFGYSLSGNYECNSDVYAEWRPADRQVGDVYCRIISNDGTPLPGVTAKFRTESGLTEQAVSDGNGLAHLRAAE